MPYLSFTVIGGTEKTKIFGISNIKNNSHLGIIKWYGPWRKYVFFPESNVIFDTICLREIIQYIDNLMLERRKK